MICTKFLKILALIIFISLISAFILFRMGKFNDYFYRESSIVQASNNSEVIAVNKTDTISPQRPDSINNIIMSSSKSIVLIDKNRHYLDTSGRKKKPAPIKLSKTEMLSSSKSAIMIDPSKINLNIDSLLSDTSKTIKTPNR
jgi:hypothetical protein